MTITKQKEGTKLTLSLDGRLDTITAPDLEKVVIDELAGVTDLLMNLEHLIYISSAGLRVILAAQKLMNRQGHMVICHVNSTVMEVFEITGFAEILTIE